MTVEKAIAQADEYCPNTTDHEQKMEWVREVDMRLINEAISRYPDLREVADNFESYNKEDLTREVIAPTPYDAMYMHYIASKIYLKLHEQGLYNNEIYIFNSLVADYKAHLNRSYRPGGPKSYKIR